MLRESVGGQGFETKLDLPSKEDAEDSDAGRKAAAGTIPHMVPERPTEARGAGGKGGRERKVRRAHESAGQAQAAGKRAREQGLDTKGVGKILAGSRQKLPQGCSTGCEER
jgi:hypothetical protein